MRGRSTDCRREVRLGTGGSGAVELFSECCVAGGSGVEECCRDGIIRSGRLRERIGRGDGFLESERSRSGEDPSKGWILKGKDELEHARDRRGECYSMETRGRRICNKLTSTAQLPNP